MRKIGVVCLLILCGMLHATEEPKKEATQESTAVLTERVKEIENELDGVFLHMQELQEEREWLREQQEKADDLDAAESEKFKQQADDKEKELEALRKQVSQLMLKWKLTKQELGYPEDQASSPYQP